MPRIITSVAFLKCLLDGVKGESEMGWQGRGGKMGCEKRAVYMDGEGGRGDGRKERGGKWQEWNGSTTADEEGGRLGRERAAGEGMGM